MTSMPDASEFEVGAPASPMFVHSGRRGGSVTGISNDCPFDWHWPDPNPFPRLSLFRSPRRSNR